MFLCVCALPSCAFVGGFTFRLICVLRKQYLRLAYFIYVYFLRLSLFPCKVNRCMITDEKKQTRKRTKIVTTVIGLYRVEQCSFSRMKNTAWSTPNDILNYSPKASKM